MSTFMHELNEGHGATVDTRLVPIIKFLNRLNVTTVSSRIEDFVTITFTGKDPFLMSELIFKHLRAMTENYTGVHLELSYSSDIGDTMGIVELPTEFLDDFSTRVGIWLEMLHK